jgi:septal ring factor EnvC (AmiA/AmiB activator)
MFKAIAEEHQKQHKDREKAMKELETKIVDSSLPALSEAIFEDLTKGSEQIVQKQKEIDKKCRLARDNWEKFNTQLGKWETQIAELDNAIKGISDIREWALAIQKQVDAACQKLEAK